MLIKKQFYKLRNEARYFLAEYPEIYFAQQRNLYGFLDSSRMISKDTDLVIEGFPSSANHYAVAAFTIAFAKPIKIAQRMHNSSALIVAVKTQKPAIALIRYPEDAISSYITRFSDIDISQEEDVLQLIKSQIDEYLVFYRKLIKYKKDLVVADFTTLTTSIDVIISRVNAKYNTNFSTLESDPQHQEKVFKLITKKNYQNHGTINEQVLPLPSEKRKKVKEKLQDYLKHSKLQYSLEQSHDIYKFFVS